MSCNKSLLRVSQGPSQTNPLHTRKTSYSGRTSLIKCVADGQVWPSVFQMAKSDQVCSGWPGLPQMTKSDQVCSRWPSLIKCVPEDQVWSRVSRWPSLTKCVADDQVWSSVFQMTKSDQVCSRWPSLIKCVQDDQVWSSVIQRTKSVLSDQVCSEWQSLSFPAIDSGKVAQTEPVCHLFRLLPSERLNQQRLQMMTGSRCYTRIPSTRYPFSFEFGMVALIIGFNLWYHTIFVCRSGSRMPPMRHSKVLGLVITIIFLRKSLFLVQTLERLLRGPKNSICHFYRVFPSKWHYPPS